MNLSDHYTTLDLRRLDEARLGRELEHRRLRAERVAEIADAAEGVTDAAPTRRGIRALPCPARAPTGPRPTGLARAPPDRPADPCLGRSDEAIRADAPMPQTAWLPSMES